MKTISFVTLCILLSLFSSDHSHAQTIKVGIFTVQDNVFFNVKDTFIAEGVYLWASWVHDHGGLELGGVVHSIQVIEKKLLIGETNPSTQYHKSLLKNATRESLLDDHVDFIIAPFSTDRTVWILEEIQAQSLATPCFGTTAWTDSVYDLYPFLWGIEGGTYLFPIKSAELTLALKSSDAAHQSYVVMYSTESPFFVGLANSLVSALANHSDARILHFEAFDGSRFDENLLEITRLIPEIGTIDDTVFYLGGNFFADSLILNRVFEYVGYTPNAAMLGGPIDTYAPTDFAETPYWFAMTIFHRGVDQGTPGLNMGTTGQFFDYYQSQMNHSLTHPYVAYGAIGCVEWAIGAQRASSDWANSTTFASAMYSIRATDLDAQTFFGPIQFNERNRNIAKEIHVVQVVDGDLRLVNIPEDAVYPAPWDWRDSGDGDGLDIEATIGIILGSIAGFLLLVIVLGAIGFIIFLVAKRKYFHLIFLPKGQRELRDMSSG